MNYLTLLTFLRLQYGEKAAETWREWKVLENEEIPIKPEWYETREV